MALPNLRSKPGRGRSRTSEFPQIATIKKMQFAYTQALHYLTAHRRLQQGRAALSQAAIEHRPRLAKPSGASGRPSSAILNARPIHSATVVPCPVGHLACAARRTRAHPVPLQALAEVEIRILTGTQKVPRHGGCRLLELGRRRRVETWSDAR